MRPESPASGLHVVNTLRLLSNSRIRAYLISQTFALRRAGKGRVVHIIS